MSPAIMALADVLRQVTDTVVATPGYTIFAKQNAPRPTGAYGDVDFISDVAIGWEQEDYENVGLEDVQQNISGMRNIGFSLGFYRDDAEDYARRVRIGFIRNSIQKLLRQANMGLITRSEVRELSQALENGWEARAQFDVFISVIGTDSDIIECINSAEIGATFLKSKFGGGFSSEYDTTIQIP